MTHSADQLRGLIDSMPSLAWSAASDGTAESFNQRWLDYTGLSAAGALGWGWKDAIHPDDLPRLLDAHSGRRTVENRVRNKRWIGSGLRAALATRMAP